MSLTGTDVPAENKAKENDEVHFEMVKDNDPAPPHAAPEKPFPEPVVLEAVVNSAEKPKEGPTTFSFTAPRQVHKEQAHPTKGDLARAKELEIQNSKPKPTLEQLDAEIAADEKADKERTYDDYRDTAEMFIEGWEAGLTFIARMISKDYSDSAYEFSVAKKEKLIHQATKVARKRGWVMPAEYMFIGTLLPASGAILLKAQDKRKEYVSKIQNQDPGATSEEITKGGPNKGFPKRRGPGRPRK